MARGKLTPKQEAFVREYLIDLNAAAAARRAGYSPKTANRIAAENLSKPVIKEAIAEAQQARAERVQITAEEVLARLVEIARGEIRVLKVTKVGPIELPPDFGDRTRALELIGKHLGMFVERVDHTTKGEALGPVAINVYLPDNGRDAEGETGADA